MSSAACANCKTPLAGRYCHVCGQPASASHPATLGHLFHELTHEILHVDGKIWRTAVALFTRPGVLTQAYWGGRRVNWIGPFLVGAIAGFWLSAGYLWLTLRRLFGEGVALATAKTLALYAAMVLIEMGLALAAGFWVARSAA